MLTIDPKLEAKLETLAKQEHSSPDEIVTRLVNEYIQRKQESGLLIEIINDLPEVTCFKYQNPLDMQMQLRDEWH
ncbi:MULTISPECIES: hypothetical protein [Nitrosomonas]|uniref:CopG family transcriptional regulator n=1 Tax=Nitrosomonas oligotropha TaxID=42354 RepID=A0A1H8QR39_9PROT|nr:hypothetical protein [Nitrosomonas oligotropha]MBX9637309.1 hypothetical protein [Nitrosomonas sp.]SDW88137.1 hypothetical protein SAMN05216300_11253 [Nitrosomonas oligotropha]SEO56690.1 hypothetical protein SAMN05216333_11274 [Nitrosomonas oligotropha]